jgi:hypothetical protein
MSDQLITLTWDDAKCSRADVHKREAVCGSC